MESGLATPGRRHRMSVRTRAVCLAVLVAGCATAEPPRPPRAATEADKLVVARTLVPLLVAAEVWRGPADGCAVALGVAPAASINLGVGPHATCKFGLLVTEGAIERLTPAEMQAALAHELGHVQLGHFAARKTRREAEKRTEEATGAAGGMGSAAVSMIPVAGPIIAVGVIGAQVAATPRRRAPTGATTGRRRGRPTVTR